MAPVTLRCLEGQIGVSGQNVTKIKNFIIKPLIWLQGCQNEIENTGCGRWPGAATMAPSGQVGSDMGITGGAPLPSGALVRASSTSGLVGVSLPVHLEGGIGVQVATAVLGDLEL